MLLAVGVASVDCYPPPRIPRTTFWHTLGCRRHCVSYMPSFGPGSLVYGSYWWGS